MQTELGRRTMLRLLLGFCALIAAAQPADAFLAYVSNEKGNTVSVIDTDKWQVVRTIKVGQRHGKPVVLRIQSGPMHRDGCPFYLSTNGVWLTDHVPPKYIDFP